MKYLKKTIVGLGLIPYGFIISLLAFYFHAGKILGRLPSYNQPDPKELSIYTIYAPLVNFMGEIWIVSFFVWLILAVTYLIVNRENISWRPVLFSLIGQVIAILLFFSGIFEWYID